MMNEGRPNILVVENEEPVRKSLVAALSETGYAVEEAENGMLGLTLVKKKFFDLFFVNYKLPDMTGIDFIRHAALASRESIPVMITSVNTLEVALEGMRAGAREYLTKPIQVKELLKSTEQILQERKDEVRGREAIPRVLQQIPAPTIAAFETVIEAPADGQKRFSPGALTMVREKLYDVLYALRKYFWNITN
jgi:DNA-binding response OmpR family regulator